MKALLSALALIFFFFGYSQTNGNSEALFTKHKPKYATNSASITYQVTGDASGSSTLHFDRGGWRSIVFREITFSKYGISSTEKILELTDGDFIYKIDVEKQKGRKTSDDRWSSLASYKDNDEIINALMESKGGVLEGKETVLNFECNVWSFENNTTSKIWEYNGIPLKIMKTLPGYSYTLEATSFDSEAQLDSSIFALSEKITWD